MTDHDLRFLLRPVARSFALNLRLLPGPMRQPLTLAYLLARLSDTVADAPGPADEQREFLLCQFRDSPESVQGNDPGFPAQVSAGERNLWNAWDQLRQSLQLSKWQNEIKNVWRRILEGQIFDIRRTLSGRAGQPLSWDELLVYADCVAGSVGVFWHEIGSRIWDDWSCLPEEDARTRARCYGEALQLLNICRDAGQDAVAGRCYLDPAHRQQALAQIHRGFADGKMYAAGLRSWRVRCATLLPANLGSALLPALENTPGLARLNRNLIRRSLLQTLWQSRRQGGTIGR